MIEAGKTYDVCELELTENGYGKVRSTQTVQAVEGQVVQFTNGQTFNLGSPLFHSMTDKEAWNEHYGKVEKAAFGYEYVKPE